MKKEIHPETNLQIFSCSTCGAEHELCTSASNVSIDICSKCHPFFTGDNSVTRATGRVERFNKRMSQKK